MMQFCLPSVIGCGASHFSFSHSTSNLYGMSSFRSVYVVVFQVHFIVEKFKTEDNKNSNFVLIIYFYFCACFT